MIKPSTVEEVELATTLNGTRVLIQRHARDDALTRNVLLHARYIGLSGEDTMTVLAFEALKAREALVEEVLHYHAIHIPQVILEAPK